MQTRENSIAVGEVGMQFGIWEILGILAIVIILFGVGRIGKIAGEMGSGIRSFKKGLQGEDEEKKPEDTTDTPPSP